VVEATLVAIVSPAKLSKVRLPVPEMVPTFWQFDAWDFIYMGSNTTILASLRKCIVIIFRGVIGFDLCCAKTKFFQNQKPLDVGTARIPNGFSSFRSSSTFITAGWSCSTVTMDVKLAL
jgi:hypothetical protein